MFTEKHLKKRHNKNASTLALPDHSKKSHTPDNNSGSAAVFGEALKFADGYLSANIFSSDDFCIYEPTVPTEELFAELSDGLVPLIEVLPETETDINSSTGGKGDNSVASVEKRSGGVLLSSLSRHSLTDILEMTDVMTLFAPTSWLSSTTTSSIKPPLSTASLISKVADMSNVVQQQSHPCSEAISLSVSQSSSFNWPKSSFAFDLYSSSLKYGSDLLNHQKTADLLAPNFVGSSNSRIQMANVSDTAMSSSASTNCSGHSSANDSYSRKPVSVTATTSGGVTMYKVKRLWCQRDEVPRFSPAVRLVQKFDNCCPDDVVQERDRCFSAAKVRLISDHKSISSSLVCKKSSSTSETPIKAPPSGNGNHVNAKEKNQWNNNNSKAIAFTPASFRSTIKTNSTSKLFSSVSSSAVRVSSSPSIRSNARPMTSDSIIANSSTNMSIYSANQTWNANRAKNIACTKAKMLQHAEYKAKLL